MHIKHRQEKQIEKDKNRIKIWESEPSSEYLNETNINHGNK